MVDYFVDLIASTNGNGTTASPWNQFTATENAGVIDGDNIWFRRVVPAVNTKIVIYKGATSPSSKINYIGWPKEGDVFYETRPEDLRATWDLDMTYSYVYQDKNTYNPFPTGVVATAVSNMSIHRFYLRNTYSSPIYHKTALRVESISNVDVYDCYLYNTYATNDLYSYPYSTPLYISSADNINLYRTIVQVSTGAYRFSNTFIIKNSTNVTFSGCSLYWGNWSSQPMTPDYISDVNTTYVYNSQTTFKNTTFAVEIYVGGTDGFHYPGILYFEDCNTTISGCTVNINYPTLNYSVNDAWPSNSGVSVFKIYQGNFNFINSNISSKQIRLNNFLVHGSSGNVNIENVDWQVTSSPQNIFLDVRGTIPITLKNITGSLYEEATLEYDKVNYLISFSDWEYIINSNITLDNVQPELGYILDMSRQTLPYNLNIKNTTIPILKHNIVYVTRLKSINIDNSEIAGFHRTCFSTEQYIYGGYYTNFPVVIKNSLVNKNPLVLSTAYAESIDYLIYNCTGRGYQIFSDGSNSNLYSLKLKSIRNKGFSSLGNIKEHEWVEAQSILDSFSNGISYFTSYEMSYQTSAVARTNGAGYSIEIIKKTIAGIETAYPRLGDDNIWVYLPSSGEHTLTAFIKYTYTDTLLAAADIKLGVDIINEVPISIIDGSIVDDPGSTWSTLPENSVNAKIQCTVTTTQPQYCPVRIYIYGYVPGLKVYLDPKIVIS